MGNTDRFRPTASSLSWSDTRGLGAKEWAELQRQYRVMTSMERYQAANAARNPADRRSLERLFHALDNGWSYEQFQASLAQGE